VKKRSSATTAGRKSKGRITGSISWKNILPRLKYLITSQKRTLKPLKVVINRKPVLSEKKVNQDTRKEHVGELSYN